MSVQERIEGAMQTIERLGGQPVSRERYRQMVEGGEVGGFTLAYYQGKLDTCRSQLRGLEDGSLKPQDLCGRGTTLAQARRSVLQKLTRYAQIVESGDPLTDLFMLEQYAELLEQQARDLTPSNAAD